MNLVAAAALGGAGLALLALTIRRPVVGCVAIVFLAPLTAGLARGSVLPVLKPSEAILLIVLAGVVTNQLTARQPRPVSALDLAVGGYVVGSVGIPWAVLFLTHQSVGLDAWRTVVSPGLFLIVYYVFSRSDLSGGDLRVVLNGALAAGVIVSLIAGAESVNLPGVRDFFAANFTGENGSPYRPSSTLGHFSAVGGFGLLTFIIALAIATSRSSDFSGRWLILVMAASVMGLIVSETWAPLVTLPIATLVVLYYGRRVPRAFWVTLILVVATAVLVWPLVSSRIDTEQLITAQGLGPPESLLTRIRYWNEFIIPALEDNLWFGTGTLIPSTVPDRLTTYVDNEYLWAGFRAGLVGIAVLVGMLLAIIWIGWRQRNEEAPMRRAVGGAAVATCLMLFIVGATAQYITFAGLSQEIAMLVGTLSALSTQIPRRAPRPVVIRGARSPNWIPVRMP